ncbi:MAG: MotA/TolQ/ExbB proton channel family protein, partial [Cyanobacteria bacterium J06628_3]
MAISNIFSAGGVVMIPLLGFSVLALALIVERMRFWLKINNRQTKVVRDVLNLYRRNNVVGAID